MRRAILLCILLAITIQVQAQDVKSICRQIDILNTQILKGVIAKPQAAQQFKMLIGQLGQRASATNITWVFPLKGYKTNAIGGTRGNGYNDKGYNFLDGNKHSAHPAHDIFINDTNQDNLDDRTKTIVPVLAIADGIVLACTNNWGEGSNLRGGKFIWLYHPALNIISYYAHNKQVAVHPGDEVKQGQQIAEVGRTGLNAFKKRSPTHLHFGAYRVIDGLPVPFNPYQSLLKAQTK